MAITIYTKEDPVLLRSLMLKRKKSELVFFGLLTSIGCLSVLMAVTPFVIWQFKTLPNINSNISKFPIPKSQVLSAESTLATNVKVLKDSDGFSYFTTDYKEESIRPKEFNVTIPKLNIENAKASVDSLTFEDNLALFPGTALPGEIGNSFITGHSVLPEFFDTKNYKTIFSNLPDLEVGDDVYVEIEGKKYQFVVQYKKIVDPTDISVLAPISNNGRNLTLMTCVPPGSNSKRMVVITSLI